MNKAIIALTILVVFLTPRPCRGAPITCVEFPDGKTFAKPDTDNEFYICIGGIPVSQKCKDGFIFVPSNGFCIKGQGGVVTLPPVDPNLCEYYPDGMKFPQPGSNTGYIVCENRQIVYRECESGYVFIESYNKCVCPQRSRFP